MQNRKEKMDTKGNILSFKNAKNYKFQKIEKRVMNMHKIKKSYEIKV